MSEDGGTNRGNGADHNHGEHGNLFHLVYVLGYSIISLAADFTFIWPENHLNGLLFLATAFSLLSLYEFRNSRKEWRIGIPIFLFAFAFFAYWLIGPKLPDETEAHGWLLSANEATPRISTCQGPGLTFIIGGNTLTSVTRNKSPILVIEETPIVVLEKKGRELAFDVDIYDDAGNLAVHIFQNEFTLVQGEYSYRNRSDDRSEMAVYDRKGDEMLFIKYVNEGLVFLRGHFFSKERVKVDVWDNNLVVGNKILTGNCYTGGGMKINRHGITIIGNQ